MNRMSLATRVHHSGKRKLWARVHIYIKCSIEFVVRRYAYIKKYGFVLTRKFQNIGFMPLSIPGHHNFLSLGDWPCTFDHSNFLSWQNGSGVVDGKIRQTLFRHGLCQSTKHLNLK